MPIQRVLLLGRSSLLLGLFAFAVAWAGPPASAQEEDPVRAMSASDRRTFSGYTRLFCRQFFRYDDMDKFIILPNYVRDREASTGKTYDQVYEEMSYTERQIRNGIGRDVTVRPPRQEALAASMVIPALEVGHYGYLNSAVIREIIDEDEAILVDVQYIYPEAEFIRDEPADYRINLALAQKALVGKTYRLHGFDTEDMIVGQRWTGPEDKGIHIAVAGTDPVHNLVLINFARLDPVRTREFVEVLEYVSMSPVEFNELARGNREDHLVGGDKATLIDIYKLYYNRFRVPRATVGSVAAVLPQPPAPEPRPPAQTPTTEPEAPERVRLDIPEREPEPDLNTEEEPEVEPELPPEPPPEPPSEPVAEPEEDTWNRNDPGPAPDAPTFFGVPVG